MRCRKHPNSQRIRDSAALAELLGALLSHPTDKCRFLSALPSKLLDSRQSGCVSVHRAFDNLPSKLARNTPKKHVFAAKTCFARLVHSCDHSARSICAIRTDCKCIPHGMSSRMSLIASQLQLGWIVKRGKFFSGWLQHFACHPLNRSKRSQ